ncbi:MAG TPA: hypothetical protein VMW76_09710 [Bacteroidales bacterium]|nr:hypothetical protein [Bacteroidales bacterium]
MKYSEGVIYKVSRSTVLQFRIIKRSGNAVMSFCPEMELYEVWRTYATMTRHLTGSSIVHHEHFPGQGKRNIYTNLEEAEKAFLLL